MRRLVLVFLAACAGMAFAQGPGRGLPAPTNLKVLTPDTYLAVMFSTRAGLGVRCDFCHALPNYASDEKPEKVTARRMMEMVKNINQNTFNGDQKVSCWTCHRGENKPAAAPAAGPGPGGPRPAGPPPPPPPPAQ